MATVGADPRPAGGGGPSPEEVAGGRVGAPVPPPVVRVAGLPAGVLSGLRSAGLADALAEIVALDDRLATDGAALADLLHGVIGADPDPAVRPRLVGLRRALHGGRLPAPAEWGAEVAAALPVGAVERVRQWVERAERRRARIAGLPDALAADDAAATGALRLAVADPGFRRALIRSSPTLDAALERWLAGAGPPRRQVLLRLARYLARAATKTSPYGTFTVSGPTCWAAAGPELAEVAPRPPATVLEVDALLVEGVLRMLLAHPEVAAAQPLRVTPGLVDTAGAVAFLGPGPAEAVVTVGATGAVRACLAAAGTSGATRSELAAALVRAGGDPERTGPFLDRLTSLGLLEVRSPIPPDSPAPLAVLAGVAERTAGTAELGAALRRLHDQLDRPVPLADLAGQRERQRSVGREAAAVAGAAGLSGAVEVARQHPGAVAHEHALLPSPAAVCGRSAWQPVLADLAVLRRWSAVHDPALPLRLVLADWVAARFGPGARLPYVLLHRAIRQEAAGPAPDPLGAELARLLDATGPGAAPEPAGPVRRLSRLAELRLAAVAPLAVRPDPDGVVRVPAAALDPRGLPAWVPAAAGGACFVQPVPRGGAWIAVLNGMTVGYGRGRTRLEHLARLAGLPAGAGPDRHHCRPEPVEISGAFGTALDARAPATRREIEYPGTVSTRPPADRIALGALQAVHDAGTGLVGLTDGAGRPVRPVHLGLVTEALLPAAARLLVRMSGSTVLPPGWTEPVPPPLPRPGTVTGTPRVEAGRVVLRRARWLVPAATLVRSPGESDAGYLLRLARWRHRHGVPARAFLHAGAAGAATGEAFDKTRKPLYVDWESGPLAATAERFVRAAGGPAGAVAVEEALPDPAAADAGQRAVELLVEVPGCGCADG